MDKITNSNAQSGTHPNEDAEEIQKDIVIIFETSPKSKAKESSSSLITNDLINIRKYSSKSQISKERNDFQKPHQTRKCIQRENSRNAKEFSSVFVDEAIFLSSESQREKTKTSSPKK